MTRELPGSALARGLVALLGASFIACSSSPKSPAGLEIIITTEGLSAPADFDDIKLEISELSGNTPTPLWDRDYLVPSMEATLPTTFTLFAGSSNEDVLISVTAFKGGPSGQPIVQRQAQVQVPTDRMADLWLVLAQVCEGQVTVTGAEGEPMSTCPSGQSCQPSTGACGSNVIDPSTLPTYTPGQDLDAGPPDAGVVMADGGSGEGAPAQDSGAQDSTVTASTTDASAEASDGQEESSARDATADSSAEGSTCTNACSASAIQCASGGGGVQTCEVQSGGCTQWVTTATCGAHQTCTGTGSSSACKCNSSNCAQSGAVCQDGQTLATCAVDGNSCPYVASTKTCPASCSGMAPTAACSATCTDSCSQGQTSCVSGALATCTLGANGCWAYGTPVACPGGNQSCTGSSSSASCACNTSVCTSLAATCASSNVATCAKDAYGCFYEASATTCSIGCHGGVCDVCSGNAVRCNGSTPQTCESGQWVSGAACSGSTPFCNAGVCGVCGNGTTQCNFNGVQTCSSGAWGSTVACPATTANCSAGVCGEPASCQKSAAGLTNCGASSESCCSSLEVTGGTFYRTYTNSGSGPTGEADPATVSGFRLDKYEVTVGRFRQFVAAWNGGWLPTAGSGKHTHLNNGQGLGNSASPGTYETGWDATDWNNTSDIDPTDANLACDSSDPTWTTTAGSQESLPINCVSWYEAYAFCIWDGGFLPSDAEWEYAAAGGSQQREYPWGSTAPGTQCPGTGCEYAIYGCDYPNGSGNCTGVANIAPVGTASMGAGVWGQLDMGGSEQQWSLDWYGTYVDPCTDCAYLTQGSPPGRLYLGSYFGGAASLTTNRQPAPPYARASTIGFRCARTP